MIDAVRASGLRGRGGGGFPTGVKMSTVATNPGKPVVVVNAAEGEPASAKDRLLVTRLPHLVLDGALCSATGESAPTRSSSASTDMLRAPSTRSTSPSRARRSAGELTVPVFVVELPGRFVAGEESALVNVINGGEARPTGARRRVFVRGVDRRPTMVSNAETYAHIAQIVARGPGWFREEGSVDEPGTMLVTLSGRCGPARRVRGRQRDPAPRRARARVAGRETASRACWSAATTVLGSVEPISPGRGCATDRCDPSVPLSVAARLSLSRNRPAGSSRLPRCCGGWRVSQPASAARACTVCPRSPVRWSSWRTATATVEPLPTSNVGDDDQRSRWLHLPRRCVAPGGEHLAGVRRRRGASRQPWRLSSGQQPVGAAASPSGSWAWR